MIRDTLQELVSGCTSRHRFLADGALMPARSGSCRTARIGRPCRAPGAVERSDMEAFIGAWPVDVPGIARGIRTDLSARDAVADLETALVVGVRSPVQAEGVAGGFPNG
jgi:hypothetical protein